MNILVTGGLGFIGHNVVKQLEELGHKPFIVDNKTNYQIIPQDELDHLLEERTARIKTASLDIDINSDKVNDLVKDYSIDTIIHLASFPRQKVVNANPQDGARVMVEGLVNLLEIAVKNKIKKFVYISSSMVYGDFNNDVDESATCKPQGQYGIFKYMGEKLVEDYSRKYGLEYTIIRPSAVYGEYDVLDRVVSMFMLGAMKGKTLNVNGPDEVLDFTYVEDAARGIVQATLSPNTINKIYNITRSSTKIVTLLDAAEIAVKIAGKGSINAGARDLDFPSRGRLDISAAKRDFDYNPQVDVEEGFKRYYEWFSSNKIYTTR